MEEAEVPSEVEEAEADKRNLMFLFFFCNGIIMVIRIGDDMKNKLFRILTLIIGYIIFCIIMDNVLRSYIPETLRGSLALTFLYCFLIVCFILSFFIMAHVKEIRLAYQDGFGYENNKVIDEEKIPMYRDIPCNKDIYYAYMLMKLNRFKYEDSNILGAILLKWQKEKKIAFKNIQSSSKLKYVIDLNMNPIFNYDFEIKLYEVLYAASDNGILENRELSKYIQKNYQYFLNLFDEMYLVLVSQMKEMGLISENSSNSRYGNVMSEKIYNDSIQLCGFKKYLEDFSRLDIKEVMEITLWDEYLMFACLFGISDKVNEQLKKIYPGILDDNIVDVNNKPLGFDMIEFIRNIPVKFSKKNNGS